MAVIPSPLAQSYRTRLNIRPGKHAYFILEDDWESLRRAARLACTQWGGIRSLLIPVSGEMRPISGVMEAFLRVHEPDLFVNYAFGRRDIERCNLLAERLRAIWPHRELSVVDGTFYENFDRSIHALGAVPDDLLRAGQLTVHRIAGSIEQAAQLAAVFGEISPGQGGLYRSSVRLRRRSVRPGTEAFWAGQSTREPFSSVVNLTTRGITTHRVDGTWPLGNQVMLCVAGSPGGVCLYWNLRATEEVVGSDRETVRRTWLVPREVLRDPATLDAAAVEIRRVLPEGRYESNIQVWFHGWDPEDSEPLRQALARAKELKEFKGRRIRLRFDSKPRRRSISRGPLRYLLHLVTLPKSFAEGVGRPFSPREEFAEGHNEIVLSPPADFTNRLGGSVAVDVESEIWGRFPRSRGLAQRIKPDGWFSKYGMTWQTEVRDAPSYVAITIPTEWEALQDFFAPAGLIIRLSPAARYGTALVGLVGGLAQVRSLASPVAYKIMGALAARSPKKLAQRILRESGVVDQAVTGDAVERLEQFLRGVEFASSLTETRKTYDELKSELTPELTRGERQMLLDVLERLSALSVVRRGFRLGCPNCATPSWHPLDALLERVTCQGCSHVFPLPVAATRGGPEIRFHYTLNSLVDRVMDQDVLPVILALHYLTRERDAACMVPGLELLRDGRILREFDFVFVAGGQIHAGECKAGRELGDKDLETASVAAALGIRHFYFVSLAGFTEATLRAVETLKQQLLMKEDGMNLEVIGPGELLSMGSD